MTTYSILTTGARTPDPTRGLHRRQHASRFLVGDRPRHRAGVPGAPAGGRSVGSGSHRRPPPRHPSAQPADDGRRVIVGAVWLCHSPAPPTVTAADIEALAVQLAALREELAQLEASPARARRAPQSTHTGTLDIATLAAGFDALVALLSAAKIPISGVPIRIMLESTQ